MRCLCCGKEIKDPKLMDQGWHKKCIRSFFGTSMLPELPIGREVLERIADENVGRGFTVPGVQKKLSLHLSTVNENRLTIVNYPTGYILKPQSDEFEELPEAEQLVMLMADITGIKTVPHGLIRMTDTVSDKETYAYISKRIDRKIASKRGQETVRMYAMEDFCQLNYRLTADKYKGSYEQCAKTIDRYSERPALDKTELFLRLIFCFISGNSDMHLKNFSLIEQTPAGRNYVLSPAYDLLPVNLIMPEDKEQTALTMNGKKRNLHRGDFLKYAFSIGIERKVAENLIHQVCKQEKKYLELVDESLLSAERKEEFRALIRSRIDAVEKK